MHFRRNDRRFNILAACCGLLGVIVINAAFADDSERLLHDGFESEQPVWRLEEAEVLTEMQVHDRSERALHDGERSEHFRFDAAALGSGVFVSYPLPKVPIGPDLRVDLYCRASTGGVALLGRVVLPEDVDPETGQPSYVMIEGAIYDEPDSWQRLELADVARAVERQVRLLRVQTGRPVKVDGAYLERLVVNLYTGPGETEVFLDDLTLGPVPADLKLEPAEASQPAPPSPTPVPGARAEADGGVEEIADGSPVRLQGGRLSLDGHDWFPAILDAPGAELRPAVAFGCDTLMVGVDEDPERLSEATQLGLRLMPDLSGSLALNAESFDVASAVAAARGFGAKDRVAFWNLGEGLGRSIRPSERDEELRRVRMLRDALAELPSGTSRLSSGTLAGLFPQYSVPGENLSLIGVAPDSWGGSLDPYDVYQYLLQRRYLTGLWSVRTPFLAWVPVTAPAVFSWNVWGRDRPPAIELARVQPEQVRLNVYAALMAGYKAIGYRGDASLNDPESKAVLYEMGLMNAEIDLVQSILTRGKDPILSLPAFPPDPKQIIRFNPLASQMNPSRQVQVFKETPPHASVRAASIATSDGRGRLILIADLNPGAQTQPQQMRYNEIRVVVPGAPMDAQAYELSLGGLRVLDRARPPGGVQFTLEILDVATMVLVTNDQELVAQLREAIQSISPRAADLQIRKARVQYDWVRGVHAKLLLRSQDVKYSNSLLAQAAEYIRDAEEAQALLRHDKAWEAALLSMGTLRLLMRDHWDAALKMLVNRAKLAREHSDGRPRGVKPPELVVPPVASPGLSAFSTLPMHYDWCSWISEDGVFARSLLPSGDFDVEHPDDLISEGWIDVGYHGEESLKAAVSLEKGWNGRGGSLQLTVGPKDPKQIDTLVPYLDHEAAAVRTPTIPVKGDTLYRIRVLARMRVPLPPGSGGLIIRDSIGGEALQYSTRSALRDWSEITLFRRAPRDMDLTITLGLAGYGQAEFDELRVEPLESAGGYPPSAPSRPGIESTADLPAAPRSRLSRGRSPAPPDAALPR